MSYFAFVLIVWNLFMNDIYTMLSDTGARVTLGNRWMVYSDGTWTVFEWISKKTIILLESQNENEAIEAFMKP